MVNVLAFDLGASSGRAVAGTFDGKSIAIRETHRFPNDFVRVGSHLYWDILRLFTEVKQGLVAARTQGYSDLRSIGIDAWGVDFGLLDEQGELLGHPYHYRDPQTQGMMEEVEQLLPRAELFARTGIQFMPINTLYQLYSLKKRRSPLLEKAAHLLLIPELLRYFLTGERISEWTIASTTQLCSPHTRNWDREIIERLDLPVHVFLEPVAPATFAGKLLPAIGEEVGLPDVPLTAVAEHDTASAVVAVPSDSASFAYLSCGTWSLLGTEVAEPVLSEQALAWNVTNEGGIGSTTRLLKNITGLWLLQECRRIWRGVGQQISYEDEAQLITLAEPFLTFIDPDDPLFASPGSMPELIQQYCRQRGQRVPDTMGAILRCIIESLAMKHRFVLKRIEQLAGQRFSGLHVVGGGAAHGSLCQWTANALARPVWAGPQEATAIGNVLVQLMVLGYIQDLQQARQIVRTSFEIKEYEPVEAERWEEAYQRFLTIIER